MKHALAGLLVSTAVLVLPARANAIPAFARRYKVECLYCHDGFPKLNTVGRHFKERGFRLEKEDDFDVSNWGRSVPVVLRAELNNTFVKGSPSFTTGLFKGISAGNLGSRISYWLDDSLAVSSGNVTHGKPDNAWLRIEVLEGNKLYVRGGRIELDLPFTQVRSSHLFSYDIYAANTGLETEGIGVHKDGVEVGGSLKDLHWSAAVVKGHSEDATGGSAGVNPDVFLRLAQGFDRNRVGAFAYFGQSTLALAPSLQWNDHILRVGGDLNVWLEHLNVYGVFEYGRNDNGLADSQHPLGTMQAGDFTGGFAQADYHISDIAALTFRLNAVDHPPLGTALPKRTYTGLFPGVQIFLFSHGKLSFEYGFQNQGQPNIGAVQAEIVF